MQDKRKYPFIRTCVDEKTADYVIKRVKEEYGDKDYWEIGDVNKEVLPDGQIKVTIDLTFDESKKDEYKRGL